MKFTSSFFGFDYLINFDGMTIRKPRVSTTFRKKKKEKKNDNLTSDWNALISGTTSGIISTSPSIALGFLTTAAGPAKMNSFNSNNFSELNNGLIEISHASSQVGT